MSSDTHTYTHTRLTKPKFDAVKTIMVERVAVQRERGNE